MQPHIPTSAILEALLAEAPEDHVTLSWLMSHLRVRSFGVVMLLLGVLGLLPAGSPAVGVLVALFACQMILARERPFLPRFVADRRLPTRRIASLVRGLVPLLGWLERFIHPRWHTPFRMTKRVIGLVILLLATTLALPVPLSNVVPALVIMLISIAYIEEDGALLCLALAAALVSLSATAAAVWAAMRAGGLLQWL